MDTPFNATLLGSGMPSPDPLTSTCCCSRISTPTMSSVFPISG